MPKFKTKYMYVLITITYLITFNYISVYYQNKYSVIFICGFFSFCFHGKALQRWFSLPLKWKQELKYHNFLEKFHLVSKRDRHNQLFPTTFLSISYRRIKQGSEKLCSSPKFNEQNQKHNPGVTDSQFHSQNGFFFFLRFISIHLNFMWLK